MKMQVQKILLVVLVGLLTTGAWAAVQIDQENPEANHSAWIGINNSLNQPNLWRQEGQTFFPTLPLLTAVEVYCLPDAHGWNSMANGTVITLSIYGLAANLPAGPALGSASIIKGDSQVNWKMFTFAAPINVSAYANQERLAYVLSAPLAANGGDYTTGWGNGGTYANGYGVVSTDNGASFVAMGAYDAIFRTYGDVPEPMTLSLLALGGLIAARRRRA
jgi:hypothetical protein